MTTRNDSDVFKIKGSRTEYDNIHNAITIARTRATEEKQSITIQRKLLHTYEPFIRIHPDGTREQLHEEPEHTTY